MSRSASASERAKWIFDVMNYRRNEAPRTPLPKEEWTESNGKKLEAVIGLIQQGKYQDADREIQSVTLPRVYGMATPFNLHALMIVEAYREQTEVRRNGQWNPCGLFTWSACGSMSGQYIAALEKYVNKDSRFDDTLVEFWEKVLEPLQKNFDGVGARLQTVLAAHGVTEEWLAARQKEVDALKEKQAASASPPAARPA